MINTAGVGDREAHGAQIIAKVGLYEIGFGAAQAIAKVAPVSEQQRGGNGGREGGGSMRWINEMDVLKVGQGCHKGESNCRTSR